jgi:cytoskeletal protein RodZ
MKKEESFLSEVLLFFVVFLLVGILLWIIEGVHCYKVINKLPTKEFLHQQKSQENAKHD